MGWAYGVTTVPERQHELLPKTLESLRNAGFPNPRLFVDGVETAEEYKELGLEVTCHWPRIRATGNWFLALQELYIRTPNAHRYALFQDDILAYKNLREYLDGCTYPEQGYWNLYTAPKNELLSSKLQGWYLSGQNGQGALALVFSNHGLKTLLRHTHWLDNKFTDSVRGHANIDGALIESAKDLGWKEYVHRPSLVQHTGAVSAIGNHHKFPHSSSFLGEDFNAMTLLASHPPNNDLRTVQQVVDGLASPHYGALPKPLYSANCKFAPVKIGLAVESMKRHMTDEGWQVFAGLEHAGYPLYGHALSNPEIDVSNILSTVQPNVVVMQDKREWDVRPGNFREPLAKFHNVQALRERDDIFKLTILKDAHNNPPYHLESAEEIGCHAWITYYHPKIVKHVAQYVREEHLIRTYHSLDKNLVPEYHPEGRNGCLLSGAVSGAYPLRQWFVQNYGRMIETEYLKHPGYHRNGSNTPGFLQLLARFKVAICTSSIFGYALRKMVEATACGCIVISDLPTDEVLPEIDDNIFRIKTNPHISEVNEILTHLYASYDPQKQASYAKAAQEYYDFRAAGIRLANDIEALRTSYANC